MVQLEVRFYREVRIKAGLGRLGQRRVFRVANVHRVGEETGLQLAPPENEEALLRELVGAHLLAWLRVVREDIDAFEEAVELLEHPQLVAEVLPQRVDHHVALLASQVHALRPVVPVRLC